MNPATAIWYTPSVLDERFWSLVDKTDECWIWRGPKVNGGYGIARDPVTNHRERAHRLSFTEAHGPIPDGLYICHRCDNPPCVRPAHLFAGSQRVNVADMRAKGRARSGPRDQAGEANNAARLTVAQVADIRAMGLAGYQHREIAARFGVHKSTVGGILAGKNWLGIEPSAPMAHVERLHIRHPLSKEVARDIRADYTGKRGDLVRLGMQHGVTPQAIHAIVNGRHYAD
jgi:hypothetical protein